MLQFFAQEGRITFLGHPPKMDFRGATIEDLNLPPCGAIYAQTSLADVREIVLERSLVVPPIVPVLQGGRVIGFLTSAQIESELGDNETELAGNHLRPGNAGKATVATPIEDLALIFARFPVVEIWDASSSHLLSTLTEHDLKTRFKK